MKFAKRRGPHHQSSVLMRSFQVVLLGGALVSIVLICWSVSYPDVLNYSAVGELLLVGVIALEGVVAIGELLHNQRSARISANSAVFELYQTYMSIDYHKNVRRPAWFSLAEARQDQEYRQKLLAELAETSSGDEYLEFWRRRSRAENETEESRAYWALDDDSHRVMDIVGFFTALSLLRADPEVIRMCNFFYDSWRLPLHRIVRDLDTYAAEMERKGLPGNEVVRGRCEDFKTTLSVLDDWFNSHSDVDDDPRFRNVIIRATTASS